MDKFQAESTFRQWWEDEHKETQVDMSIDTIEEFLEGDWGIEVVTKPGHIERYLLVTDEQNSIDILYCGSIE